VESCSNELSHAGSLGKTIKLNRLFRRGDGRLFILPLDHSVSDGPIAPVVELDRLVGAAAAGGVDAVVLHKGRVRSVAPGRWRHLALIVHLSASTRHAADPNAKVLVASVEDAAAVGADAVSVHVNVGCETESEQLADLGAVATAANRWHIPLLAMMYPRGPRVKNPADPALVAHVANLAADLGADLVKTVYTGSVETMRDVVRTCPIPVLAAGGPRFGSVDDVLAYVREVLDAGVRGVAIGRNVFMAPDPELVIRLAAAVVHGRSAEPAAACSHRA
jgi:2-amino-4,5-dihydroxy-6-oxo-7-(phosphooxy)heptanoate synthase